MYCIMYVMFTARGIDVKPVGSRPRSVRKPRSQQEASAYLTDL